MQLCTNKKQKLLCEEHFLCTRCIFSVQWCLLRYHLWTCFCLYIRFIRLVRILFATNILTVSECNSIQFSKLKLFNNSHCWQVLACLPLTSLLSCDTSYQCCSYTYYLLCSPNPLSYILPNVTLSSATRILIFQRQKLEELALQGSQR